MSKRPVSFGASSAAASAPMASATGAPARPVTTSAAISRRPGSVSVPVLSMHSTSARARPSIAASSCTRTRCLASRSAPAANAREVSSTRPSGTMATTPAAEPRAASRSGSWLRKNSLPISSSPAGIITQVTRRRIWLVPRWSSDRT